MKRKIFIIPLLFACFTMIFSMQNGIYELPPTQMSCLGSSNMECHDNSMEKMDDCHDKNNSHQEKSGKCHHSCCTHASVTSISPIPQLKFEKKPFFDFSTDLNFYYFQPYSDLLSFDIWQPPKI